MTDTALSWLSGNCTSTQLSVSNTLATSLVTETDQHKGLMGIFFFLISKNELAPSHTQHSTDTTSCQQGRSTGTGVLGYACMQCSVGSHCATLTQFDIHVLSKAAHQP